MAMRDVTPVERHNQSALIDTPDFIRETLRVTLQEILEAEMTRYLGAEPYERTDERTGSRNGYKDRTLHLKVGSIPLKIPQAREGGFSTELFERYQRSERAFTAAIVEMWLAGVSSRKVADITEALSSVTFSKSTVSGMCKSLDGHISTWKARDLSAYTYPYLLVDAITEHVRKDGMIVTEGMLIVGGVRSDGTWEVLDATICDTESEASYSDLFCSLKKRGLAGVRLVISDAHAGLKAAIECHFQGAAWQRCQVHFQREAMGKVAKKYRSELGGDISAIFEQSTKDKAIKRAWKVADKWRDRAPRVASMIVDGIEWCLNILAFPEEHRIHIRTNNVMERLNREIRRRDRVIGIFPNEASVMRLVCALCIEISEEWTTAKARLDMSLLDVAEVPIVGRIEPVKPLGKRKVS